jgi:hypothetical protein
VPCRPNGMPIGVRGVRNQQNSPGEGDTTHVSEEDLWASIVRQWGSG